MNVFEDLIEELKEENLLEETVIEFHTGQEDQADFGENNSSEQDFANLDSAQLQELEEEARHFPVKEYSSESETLKVAESSIKSEINEDVEEISAVSINDAVMEQGAPPAIFAEKSANIIKPVDENEFYRKRAMDEVSCLQMVEQVFAGVEREQMKMTPKPYDSLAVQIALHDFLQVSKNVNSSEHAKAEFQLMQETESWYSALSQRDKHITVSSLRRFCETTRPVLSAQALTALARFYRNSPFTEHVRSKFDLVITRLFSKEIANEKRELIFSRDELIENLTSLYAEWASIPLYSTDEENSDVLISTLKFEDFMAEAENASSLNEILKNDFFNLLRTFKESVNENFFAPLVTATSIEANVKIGNRYIDLIRQAQRNDAGFKLEEEHGFLHDQIISEAVSKSLVLTELLNRSFEKRELTFSEAVETKVSQINEQVNSQSKPKKVIKKPSRDNSKFFNFRFNKWLLAATVLVVLISIGLYTWVEYSSSALEKSNESVKKVNLDNSSLKEYVKEGRISKDTFFAITLSSWDNLSTEKKEEILKKIQAIGNEKGFTKVNLLSNDGKLVGYAADNTVATY